MCRREDWLPSLRGSLFLISVYAAGLSSPAVAIETIYANALHDADYEVFKGDVNGDTRPDLLARSKKEFVLIDFEVPFIIPLPWRRTFALLSNGDGSYSLVLGPSGGILNHPNWQSGGYELIFGDTDGDGNDEMLVRATTPGFVNALIGSIGSNGSPGVLQILSATRMGFDIGTQGFIVDLIDTNDDGRADLLVESGGVVSAVYLAQPTGVFSEQPDSGGTAPTKTTYQYDSLGRLVKATNGDNSTIDYRYDPAGNRTQIKRTPAP